jgi:hypothetical protein
LAARPDASERRGWGRVERRSPASSMPV